MPGFESISSVQHPWLQHLKRLVVSTKYRKECKSTVVTNLSILKEQYVKSKIKSIIYFEKDADTALEECKDVFTIRNRDLISFASGSLSHDGIIAEVGTPSIANATSDELAFLTRSILLPNITDPGNLGMITRSSMALGSQRILLGDGSVDPFNFKAVAASKGLVLKDGCLGRSSTKQLFHCRRPTVIAEIPTKIPKDYKLKRSFGFTDIYTKDYTDIANLQSANIIMGSESHGFEGINMSDLPANFFYASIRSSIDCMNVATAMSVIMASIWKPH